MSKSEITPTTPAQVLELVARYIDVQGQLERAGRTQEAHSLENSPYLLQMRINALDPAALRAQAEALSGIEGLAIAWEATAARIRRTEVRPDGQWMDIESAQVHGSLITCARQLRALLPSPPVEDLVSPLASPDDDESETDFLVGQRVIVHGTLMHIHDTSDGEDADEFSGEPGVIVADVTDNPYYHHLVYVPRTQRVYGCVIGDLSDAAWGEE